MNSRVFSNRRLANCNSQGDVYISRAVVTSVCPPTAMTRLNQILSQHNQKKSPPTMNNCIFVSSPNALTELRLAIKSLYLEKICEIVIVDDVSSMREYNDLGELTQFLNNIILIARENNKKLVLIIDKTSNELINDLTMFSDLTI